MSYPHNTSRSPQAGNKSLYDLNAFIVIKRYQNKQPEITFSDSRYHYKTLDDLYTFGRYPMYETTDMVVPFTCYIRDIEAITVATSHKQQSTCTHPDNILIVPITIPAGIPYTTYKGAIYTHTLIWFNKTIPAALNTPFMG